MTASSDTETTFEFAAFERRYRAMLYATALRLCRDDAQAKDLVQDALERAWLKRQKLSHVDNPAAWVLRILNNRFIDLCRRGSRSPAVVPLEEAAHIAEAAEDEAPIWAEFTRQDVHDAIEELNEPFATTLRLRDVEGKRNAEIAAELGVKHVTVRARISKGREKLKKILLGRLIRGRS